MKHEAAAAWDSKFGKSLAHHRIEGDKLIPINRPCDWCGQPVDEYYIHKDCAKKRN